ncbi:hypothetical protein V8F20_006443 [Naviculisporaceae sp. PSN 640]
MKPYPVIGLLLLGWLASCSHAQNTDGQFVWATSIITETIWKLCSEVVTGTVYQQEPYSTNLVLPDAVLTEVTVHPSSSPTSCYNLPIPTPALDIVAFSADRASPDATDQDDPVFFYLGENATVPEYVATLIDGERYLLDVSSDACVSSRVALILAEGESLVVDQTGMHYFDSTCGSASSVVVKCFLDQIGPMVDAEFQRMADERRLNQRAMATTNFTVAVQVEDVIGSLFYGPEVWFGPSQCDYGNRDDFEGWSTHTWSCQHPGENSTEKQCERAFLNWMRPNTTWASSSGQSSAYLLHFISKAGPALSNLFPAMSPSFTKGLNWLSKAGSAVVDIAEFGGESICQALHQSDEYFLVLSDPGLSSVHTIGAYVSPPVSIISKTMNSQITNPARAPPRAVQPGVTGFPTVTATEFLPTIFGPL